MMNSFFQIRTLTTARQIEYWEIRLMGLKIRIPRGSILSYMRKKRAKMRRRREEKKQIKKALPEFLKDKEAYLARKDKDVIRRLYITAGNLQLINVLTIIEQQKEADRKQVENHLLVWSNVSNKNFEELNAEIAREYGIEHYYTCYGLDMTAMRVACYLLEKKLSHIDEVYCLMRVGHIDVYNMLYRGCEQITTDESFSTLIPTPELVTSPCKKLITTCYLDKMDYVEFAGRQWEVQYLSKTHFQAIARRCAGMYPWPQMQSGNKTILFCATFPAAWDTYTSERQQYFIERLLECGYDILYKPHPRDPMLPTETDRLKILHTRLPLECYQPTDVLAVVSLYSSASTQSYHYCGIPGFIDYESSQKVSMEHEYVLQINYTPSIERLLELDAQKLTYTELQEQINRAYAAHVNDKPMMSQDEHLTQIFQKALKTHHF